MCLEAQWKQFWWIITVSGSTDQNSPKISGKDQDFPMMYGDYGLPPSEIISGLLWCITYTASRVWRDKKQLLLSLNRL